MKQYALHYIYAALFLVVATAATPSACMARGIRIIPRSIQVLRDSLHLHLLMDLNQVSVGSSLAITFTPVLSHKKQQLDLSAVAVHAANEPTAANGSWNTIRTKRLFIPACTTTAGQIPGRSITAYPSLSHPGCSMPHSCSGRKARTAANTTCSAPTH